MKGQVASVLIVVALIVGAGLGYIVIRTRISTTTCQESVTTVASTQSSVETISTFMTPSAFPIIINYSGSWNLVYLATSGTQSIKGNLTCSGVHVIAVGIFGMVYAERTICAKATKLDSQGHTLTLTVAFQSNSTTASNPSTEVCATYTP